MLGVLASMYWEAPMTVKNGGVLGPTFVSCRGVRQGDPLSPLLFGIFIDWLEAWLAERLPDSGLRVGAQLVRLMLYADDLTLLATLKEELQTMLDCLQASRGQFRLEVNVAKCAAVVFGKSAPRPGREIPVGGWLYGDQQVPVVESFRYLGLFVTRQKGCRQQWMHCIPQG